MLCLANAVDSSLLRDRGPWLQSAFDILDEMISRGNLIAGFHKSELQQLDANLKMLPATPRSIPTAQTTAPVPGLEEVIYESAHAGIDLENALPERHDPSALMNFDTLGSEWNLDDGMSGQQLLALADSLDFGQLDWIESDLPIF